MTDAMPSVMSDRVPNGKYNVNGKYKAAIHIFFICSSDGTIAAVVKLQKFIKHSDIQNSKTFRASHCLFSPTYCFVLMTFLVLLDPL